MKWIDVLIRTSAQSLSSTGLALCFGFFLAVFLLSELSAKQKKWSTVFLLWPSLMPAYFWFMVLGFKGQSVGLLIFVQTLMNMGWVAWRLQRYWSDQLSRSLELCFVEGASWSRILSKVLWPLSRSQIFHIGVSVFLFCFSNYSLALLMAGSSWSLDVFLVEAWQQGKGILPTVLSALGLWVAMLLVYLRAPPSIAKPQVNLGQFPMLKTVFGKWILPLLLFTPLILFYFFFYKVPWNLFFSLIPWTSIFDSFLVGLTTGWFLCMFSALSIWAWSVKKLNFFLSTLVSPPISLLGLGLSLLEWREGKEIVVMGFGFALLLWPLLYRVFVAPYYSSLITQIQTAEVCGASKSHIFLQVVLPQVGNSLFSMSALGAFWSVGDFSLSTVLSSDTRPLAKLILEKLNRYEMELAHAWFLWLMITAFIVAFFFVGCAYVANRKSAASVR